MKFNVSIIKNFSFLTLLQVFNILGGIVIVPYLIVTLGDELYGVQAFCQAICAFVLIIINYGFNITATRKIVENRGDSEKVSQIFFSVIYLKGLLFLLCYLVLWLILFFIQYEHSDVLVLMFMVNLGWVFYPDWFFQGIEKMYYITLAMIIPKVFFLLSVFLFVKTKLDFDAYIYMYVANLLLTGILGFVFALKNNYVRIYFKGIVLKNVLIELQDGSAYFFSNIVANAKDYGNTILIGAFLDYKMVTVYDLAVKLVKVAVIPVSMLGQASFPQLVRINSVSLFNKIRLVFLVYSVCILLLIFFIPDKFLIILFKNIDIEIFKNLLRIMSFSILLLSFTVLYGTLGLLRYGQQVNFTKNILKALFVYIALILLLIFFDVLTAYNLSISILISIALEGLMHFFAFKNCNKEIRYYEK